MVQVNVVANNSLESSDVANNNTNINSTVQIYAAGRDKSETWKY